MCGDSGTCIRYANGDPAGSAPEGAIYYDLLANYAQFAFHNGAWRATNPAGSGAPVTVVPGVAYSFVAADRNGYVQFTNGAAVAATVPPNVFPIGAVLTIEQAGAGVVTLTAGAGVTLNARGGLVASNGQFAVLGLKQTAANIWTVYGDRA